MTNDNQTVMNWLESRKELGRQIDPATARANFVLLESGGIPDALSMSESLGIDSFLGASDAEALFHRLAWPSD